MVALASGEVGFSVNNILDTRPFVNQGKLRALAVTGTKRSPAMPDVPTLVDSGVEVEANIWTGLFAPAATPKPIVDRLNQELTRVFDTREMREWLLNSLGGELPANTPEQFAAFLASDTAQWQKIVKQLAIQLD
jgi:tripartite-type tricarboxylate transporter receptor subunit TctC